jgi:hypothetical protein
MGLIQIKHAVRRLSISQLRKLDEWLHDLIRKAEEANPTGKFSARKQTVSERSLDNKTYRLESVRCGNKKCRCVRGELHGPYWYSYTRVKDKVTSQYIGKNLPKDIKKKLRSRSDS